MFTRCLIGGVLTGLAVGHLGWTVLVESSERGVITTAILGLPWSIFLAYVIGNVWFWILANPEYFPEAIITLLNSTEYIVIGVPLSATVIGASINGMIIVGLVSKVIGWPAEARNTKPTND